MANKIKSGLKNVYYAPVTVVGGVVTYGTPVAITGAVSLSLKGDVEMVDIPADDNPQYATMTDNKGYNGDIEFALLPDSAKVDILGATLDSNNCIVENKDDVSNPVALLFEFAGDAKAIRHVLYNCLITKPDMESKTKGDKVDAQTDKLSIKARPAVDTGNVKYKTTDTTTTSVYDDWYDAVTLPNTTITTQISPDDVVFDKKTANQEDVIVNVVKVASETLSSISGSTVLTLTTHYTVSGNVVTVKKTYLATLTVGTHDLAFAFSNGTTKTLQVTVIDTTAA